MYENLDVPENLIIYRSILVATKKINDPAYKKIMCSISGGSDSDIVLDIVSKVDFSKKVVYVFFDTKLEYEATKKHLKYLEEKYNIKIQWIEAKKPIPSCCRKYGQPFLSKQVSEWISRLQKHNFKWEDETFEVLIEKYPRCRAALKWWCNCWEKKKNGSESSYNIAYNRYLKEFMILHNPDFEVSNACCHWAKKMPAEKFKRENGIDLSVVGVRKAEGGARSTAYKNCFTPNLEVADEYRTIFYYTEESKKVYENFYRIEHSDCYRRYGLKRTGCAGCPYGNDFEFELEVIKKHELKLYTAVNNIFGKSYEYTRKYNSFKKQKRGALK